MSSPASVRDIGSTVSESAPPSLPINKPTILHEPVPTSISPAPPVNYGAIPSGSGPLSDTPKESREFHGFQGTKHFVLNHIGLLMLLGAQFLASVQALTTRFLAISLPEGRKYHAFEVMFARMTITLVGCLAWMWWNSVEHAPFGRKDVRWLLVMRGFGGLVGIYGLYSQHTGLPTI